MAIRVIRGQILIDGGRVAHESARIDTNKEEEVFTRRRGGAEARRKDGLLNSILYSLRLCVFASMIPDLFRKRTGNGERNAITNIQHGMSNIQ